MIETLSDQWPSCGIWLQSLMALCFHRINFIVWTVNVESWSLCHAVLCLSEVWSLVSYTYFILVTDKHIYSSLVLHLCDLITCLQAVWCNITEWAQSTYPSLGWTNPALIDTYSSTYPLRNTQDAPLWLSYYGVTVDTLSNKYSL